MEVKEGRAWSVEDRLKLVTLAKGFEAQGKRVSWIQIAAEFRGRKPRSCYRQYCKLQQECGETNKDGQDMQNREDEEDEKLFTLIVFDFV